MQTERPVFLNLFQIHLPVMGMVSILHRLTGVLLALLIPGLLWLLELSLTPEGYQQLGHWLQAWPVRLGMVVFAWILAHHLLAGLRFLLLDLEIGVNRKMGRGSAWSVHIGAALITLTVALGVILA